MSGSLRYSDNNSISIKQGYTGFYDFETGEKGNSVDFLARHLGYTITEAVAQLTGTAGEPPAITTADTADMKEKSIEIPVMSQSNEKIHQYLHGRGIAYPIIDRLIEENLLYQDRRQNCVFLNSRCDWGEIRGTGSAPFHGILKNSRHDGFWHFQTTGAGGGDEKKKNKSVFICESAIDAVSLYEFYRLTKDPLLNMICIFISIGGVGKQATIDRLVRNEQKKNKNERNQLFLAVDNDEAGERCRSRNNINLTPLTPKSVKDWNELLIQLHLQNAKKNQA